MDRSSTPIAQIFTPRDGIKGGKFAASAHWTRASRFTPSSGPAPPPCSHQEAAAMATKDRRLYARFDIGMDEHPKVMLLSDAAFRALIESTMYARRQLTDGFLDERIVSRKWGADVANELTSNASDRPSWLKVDGGYRIHDFAEHQVTSADIEAKRAAGRAGGLAKSKQAASKRVAPASKVPKQIASTSLAKTETETET